MHNRTVTLATCLGLAGLFGCAGHDTADFHSASKAQLFDDMGRHHRKISTDSAEAQEFFDQGMAWSYGFNHDEAIRAFARAAEIDPDSAMAWWGAALCQGPNYNDPEMTDRRSAAAWEALQQALAHIDNTTPVERALIEALSFRYEEPWPADRAHLDKAYADAMAEVWHRFPNDSDVGTLYAEAMMVRTPWKLYSVDHEPAQDTPEIVATLERVLEMDSDNPGANHLYIHAVEPSGTPDRGLGAADRLGDLVPGSGHLEHMPSHIYVKTGRWDRAVAQNQKAMRADRTYSARQPVQRRQHGYRVHNAHMLAYAAMMSGREWDAMAAARAMWEIVPDDVMSQVGPYFDRWMCSVYDVQKRFGRWDDLLAEDPPPAYLPITTAVWHAHRTVAYAAKKDFDNAEREFEAFRRAKARIPDDLKWGRDAARTVLEVSDYFIAGEIALHRGDLDEAASLLERAAEIEDTLGYGEPPQWLQPTRHTLGAVYLTMGRPEDAERVYREDLAKWRNNGWSLYGLGQALEAQGRAAEARDVQRQYAEAWGRADSMTETSCKCIPKT
jgi:tetratricopeptide (TPR) repeat protein